jgi:RNA polymerase sigma-54 factor
MNMTFAQLDAPVQQQAPHWLVTANQMLEFSSIELQSFLHTEIEENPALELEERPICFACGQTLQGAYCSQCRTSAASSQDTGSLDEFSLHGASNRTDDDDFDPLALCMAPVSLKDELLAALQAELPAEAAPIIAYLVGNLDEDGYLRCPLEEAAEVLHVSLQEVEAVLAHLQAQEPAGIGARSVRESLLLQLRALEMEGRFQPYAREIVDRFLWALGKRQYEQIARELGISRQTVIQVHEFFKRELTPFPARRVVERSPGPLQVGPTAVVPQVAIRRQPQIEGGAYTIEIIEAQQFRLRVSPSYLQAYQDLRGQPALQREAERAHLQQYVGRARLLIFSLRKRWQTLGRITRYLVQRQQAFLEQGVSALQPLTRAEVAEALGLHPSTVSRAMADKFVLLPNTQVIPFSTFFESNLPIKAALKEILDQESRPLSDQRLTELLAERGMQVARRTVNKYREALKIPARSRR